MTRSIGAHGAKDVARIIAETMAIDMFGRLDTPEVRVEMTAISLQECRGRERVQLVGSPPRPTGPARGLWQFERRGGVLGVLTHPISDDYARALCARQGVKPTSTSVHYALAFDDILACGFARLLLLTDPRPLPKLYQSEQAWDYYVRNWQPGKPHHDTWAECYRIAIETITRESAL